VNSRDEVAGSRAMDSARKLFLSVAIHETRLSTAVFTMNLLGSLNIVLFERETDAQIERLMSPFVWCKEKDPPFVLTSRHT
jgi:hypothetical protein